MGKDPVFGHLEGKRPDGSTFKIAVTPSSLPAIHEMNQIGRALNEPAKIGRAVKVGGALGHRNARQYREAWAELRKKIDAYIRDLIKQHPLEIEWKTVLLSIRRDFKGERIGKNVTFKASWSYLEHNFLKRDYLK